MAEASGTRVRWNGEEIELLVVGMARLIEADGMSAIDALRKAQSLTLPLHRQRDVPAWSVVAPRLAGPLAAAVKNFKAAHGAAAVARQSVAAAPAGDDRDAGRDGQADLPPPLPPLAAPDAAIGADAPPPAAGDAGPAAASPPGDAGAAPVGHRAAAVPALPAAEAVSDAVARALAGCLPQTLAEAFVGALQSTPVRAALADAMAQALADALRQGGLSAAGSPGLLGAGASAGAGAPRAAASLSPQRLLLAGFAGEQARELESALAGHYDVRRWQSQQGPQALEALVNSCSVAVIPDDADDELADAMPQRLHVFRHSGNVQRLLERIGS